MKKPNGTGTLYLRDRIWWVKLYVDGKPIYASTKSTKVSDAKRFRDQMLAKKLRGEIIGGKPDKILLGELLDDVLASDIAESMILAFWFGPATAVKFGPLGQHWLGFMDGATEA